MDSLLTGANSIQTKVEADATISPLVTSGDFATEIHRPEDEEPRGERMYTMVIIPNARRRYKQIGGRTLRLLGLDLIIWQSAQWDELEIFTGRGSTAGLDDICDRIELVLSQSNLDDTTILCPTGVDEPEALSQGEYIAAGDAESKLTGVRYQFVVRRDIS